MADTPREPTPEDIDKLVTLLRRSLVRLATVENRLAAVEERLHRIEDLPEQVQGLRELTNRVLYSDGQLKALVANMIDKRLRKAKDS